MCVQETHRDETQSRPHIPGLELIAETSHPKHGNAVFATLGISTRSVECTTQNGIEVITIDFGYCTVTSVYKPPGTLFEFFPPNNFNTHPVKVVVGDFNSHSTSWGYDTTDASGQAVEEWAETNNLTLIHSPKLPSSFNSGRWRRGYNPDLIFVSDSISSQCIKTVCSPIPRSQHRPIMCTVQPVVHPLNVQFRRRFNYSKGNWELFARMIDDGLREVSPVPKNYSEFVELVSCISRKCIPRGCRTSYIPGLSKVSAELLKEYETLYKADPFSEDTVAAGEELLQRIGDARQEKWIKMVTSIDLTHNSKKAWHSIRMLTSDPPPPQSPYRVTANQVAHQLLLNGKSPGRLAKVPKLNHTSSCDSISKPFNLSDIVKAIQHLQRGKASGMDNISVEQLQHLGPVAVSWLLQLFNCCLESAQVPSLWRKSKVIALPKPGKTTDNPKHFRPISLLCHTYKLFERLLLTRLTGIVDPKLITEQAGFRPAKSCCSQTLKLTQHIEDGFELGKVTGAVFVDLSAAYDTVNLRRLLWKVETMTGDHRFVMVLRELLHNRRFQVNLLTERSRWRAQKNGLPQGSVLAPLLFNIYTNDQPSSPNTSRFLYADDLALTSQHKSFEEVEADLTVALNNLSAYYKENSLKPNPSKTESCAFHLRNNQAGRKLDITWQGVPIAHNSLPKYLGITLDRSLTYRKNCENVKKKVHSRNNILQRLTTTKWGASPQVLRTSGLALAFSVGEYACPVWGRSAHAKLVDTALNETCRIITGCLKPTPVQMLYPLAGIAPPDVRRTVASSAERAKMDDTRHPMHGFIPAPQRLPSRRSFMKCVDPLNTSQAQARCALWRQKVSLPTPFVQPSENLPPGHKLPWETWKSLNRLRTQVGRSKDNMARWGFTDAQNLNCLCEAPQTMVHLTSCPACPYTCTREELMTATSGAVSVAQFWACII
ncbi:hypothetical protein JYU34_016540 [Plutella xylostella]|uniref:Reverse transcriptase domain-containing protein n=2 Tax=Plutella xylostella TaxID=51655 RepID=A0ABQ7Q499_PLUXY|nr:hypothetical protein JYU34_016540 [Plutella xylostella]